MITAEDTYIGECRAKIFKSPDSKYCVVLKETSPLHYTIAIEKSYYTLSEFRYIGKLEKAISFAGLLAQEWVVPGYSHFVM